MGDVVEVWCPSTGRWVPGYRILDRRDDGSVVVAHADGVALPVPLDPSAVREAAASPWSGWRADRWDRFTTGSRRRSLR